MDCTEGVPVSACESGTKAKPSSPGKKTVKGSKAKPPGSGEKTVKSSKKAKPSSSGKKTVKSSKKAKPSSSGKKTVKDSPVPWPWTHPPMNPLEKAFSRAICRDLTDDDVCGCERGLVFKNNPALCPCFVKGMERGTREIGGVTWQTLYTPRRRVPEHGGDAAKGPRPSTAEAPIKI